MYINYNNIIIKIFNCSLFIAQSLSLGEGEVAGISEEISSLQTGGNILTSFCSNQVVKCQGRCFFGGKSLLLNFMKSVKEEIPYYSQQHATFYHSIKK